MAGGIPRKYDMGRPSTSRHRISAADMRALRLAWEKLEHPGLAARLTAVVGTPIEEGIKLLPRDWYARVRGATETAMLHVLGTAVATLPMRETRASSDDLYKMLGIGAGAVGGFFGLPGVLVEVPVTTGIILRSIASIAASEGEDLSRPEGRLACVEVFALGGPRLDDDAAETGYYSLRLALAFHFSLVGEQLIERSVVRQGLPSIVNLARAIAARFGIAVSDKLAMQMVPVLGAAGGALLNAIFVQHFQDMARGHFTVRRLERTYGADAVRRAYDCVDEASAYAQASVLTAVNPDPGLSARRLRRTGDAGSGAPYPA
jgi:hypothetical protein